VVLVHGGHCCADAVLACGTVVCVDALLRINTVLFGLYHR
jgi:hypothetical protein